MHSIWRLAFAAVLLPGPVAAQSLPKKIIGHRLPVPGVKVDGTTARLSEVERELVEGHQTDRRPIYMGIMI